MPTVLSPTDTATRQFIRRVMAAAREVARTDPRATSNLGDKVLISYAYRQFIHNGGKMSLAAFKRQLWDANGEGLVLVREDLVPQARRADFTESAVIWHVNGEVQYHWIRI